MAAFSSEGLSKCDTRLFEGAFFPLSLLVQLDPEKVIMFIKTEHGRVFQQLGEHKKLLGSCERDFVRTLKRIPPSHKVTTQYPQREQQEGNLNLWTKSTNNDWRVNYFKAHKDKLRC